MPHRSFIAKLSQLNISEFLLKWIINYLTDTDVSVLESKALATSLPLPVLSGDPQGSVLGLIYIAGLLMSCPIAA